MLDPQSSLSDAGQVRERGAAPRALGHDRQARILALLAEAGSVGVGALSADLGVSEMTIRRDLLELEREGRLRRVHGGAVAADVQPPVTMDHEEPAFESRLRQRRAAKEAIAACAAGIAGRYRAIALDVGTTTYLMAAHLRGLGHAKIFTNSVRIAGALEGAAGEVYLAGGRIRPDELSTFGPSAVAQFEALWFDVAVIGVSGVTPEGLFDYSFEDSDLKRVYLRRAGLRIAVCDSAKFQRMSLVQVAALTDINILVTDAPPPEPLAAALRAARVDLQIAPQISPLSALA